MENYSLRIETLLCEICPEMKGMQRNIAKNPIKEILDVLEFRISKSCFDKFKKFYSGEQGKTMDKLIEEKYDLEKLLIDLKLTIEENGGR